MISGEEGVQLVFQTGIDLSTATAIKLLIEDPLGNLTTLTCTASAQNALYTTQVADFATAGTYQAQIEVTFPGNIILYSPQIPIYAAANLTEVP